jgi:hypothetical protein
MNLRPGVALGEKNLNFFSPPDPLDAPEQAKDQRG